MDLYCVTDVDYWMNPSLRLEAAGALICPMFLILFLSSLCDYMRYELSEYDMVC